jgi:hypothetical protein
MLGSGDRSGEVEDEDDEMTPVEKKERARWLISGGNESGTAECVIKFSGRE